MLKEWTNQGHLQTEIKHKLQEWFEHGLKPWDITRDAPYFGFKIPGEDNKYFYFSRNLQLLPQKYLSTISSVKYHYEL